MAIGLYTSGKYLERNPAWHVDESAWKVYEITKMLRRHQLAPQTVCEVGCGAGEVLRLLQRELDDECRLHGYDIAPQAIALSQSRANGRLTFTLGDVREEQDAHFDVLLLMDVIEHIEDYFSLLRDVHAKSRYTILQVPLDLSVRSIVRNHLVEWREEFGHIHYFTKELALHMLREQGYSVLDAVYTRQPLPRPTPQPGEDARARIKRQVWSTLWSLRKVPATACFALDEDLAAHIFGEWRLLVLAE